MDDRRSIEMLFRDQGHALSILGCVEIFVDFLPVAETHVSAAGQDLFFSTGSMRQLYQFVDAVRCAQGTSALGIAAQKLFGWLHFMFFVPSIV